MQLHHVSRIFRTRVIIPPANLNVYRNLQRGHQVRMRGTCASASNVPRALGSPASLCSLCSLLSLCSTTSSCVSPSYLFALYTLLTSTEQTRKVSKIDCGSRRCVHSANHRRPCPDCSCEKVRSFTLTVDPMLTLFPLRRLSPSIPVAAFFHRLILAPAPAPVALTNTNVGCWDG